MAYQVETPSETEAEVKVSVDPQTVSRAFDRQFRELAKNVKIPGFRPGKIPRKILEKRYGSEVEVEVLRELVEADFQEAVREHKLRPLEPPNLEKDALQRTEAGGLEVSLKIHVIPDFTLPDYRSLQIPAPPIELKQDEVDQQIERMRSQSAKVEDAGEGPIGPSDLITADLVYMFHDGTSLPPMEERIIDTHAGVLDGVPCTEVIGAFTGHKVGDKIKVTFDLPKDHPLEEHREKTAVVECMVKKISQVHLPDATSEEFLGPFEVASLDELKERIGANMTQRMESQRDRMVEATCVEQLLDRCEFAVPMEFVNRLCEAEKEKIRKRAEEGGADSAQAEQDILLQEGRMKADIERSVRSVVLLDRIAEEEEVKVDDQDLQRHFTLMSMSTGMPAQELFDYTLESGSMPALLDSLRRDKVRKFLRTSSTMSDELERGPTSAPEGETPDPDQTNSAEEEN